jgi:hypothetical protein
MYLVDLVWIYREPWVHMETRNAPATKAYTQSTQSCFLGWEAIRRGDIRRTKQVVRRKRTKQRTKKTDKTMETQWTERETLLPLLLGIDID